MFFPLSSIRNWYWRFFLVERFSAKALLLTLALAKTAVMLRIPTLQD
jgi:hypothetical protein